MNTTSRVPNYITGYVKRLISFTTVGGKTDLEVVRVSDLRAWIRDEGTDVGRLLQGLGMAPRNPGRRVDQDWKITLFDVRSEWMCRPLEGSAGGEDASGILSCDERRPLRHGALHLHTQPLQRALVRLLHREQLV